MKKFIIKVDGKPYEVEVEEVQATAVVATSKTAQLQASIAAPSSPSASANKSGSVVSPMPGNILKINVKIGDKVEAKQTILILEAMKMENAITAPKAGTVTDIQVKIGDCVPTGQLLLTIE